MTNSSRYSKGRTLLEIITGITPDISEYVDFGFYDWVVYKTNAGVGDPELARWLGVSHRVGQLMSYWVLPESGIPISCTTVQRLTIAEQQTDEWKERMTKFKQSVKRRWDAQGTDLTASVRNVNSNYTILLETEDDKFKAEYSRVIDSKFIIDADHAKEVGVKDPYLSMELGI